MMHRRVLAFVLAGACGAPPTAPSVAAEHARIEPPREGDAAIVRLSDAAIERLGIETTVVGDGATPRVRTVAGVVTLPAGSSVAVTAPVAGTLRAGDREVEPGARVVAGEILMRLVPLAPVDRDIKAQSRRQAASTQARLDLATARVQRIERLLADRAASTRALEEARAELDTATAEHAAASSRERAIDRAPLSSDVTLRLAAPQDGILRARAARPGQVVAAGAPLFEVTPAAGLWLRVPVYAGDLAVLDDAAPVAVSRLGRGAPTWIADPVHAPPSADPSTASVDRFYALPLAADLVTPGERVAVRLQSRASGSATSVPHGAIVLDFDGGAWVYACEGVGGFSRRRVEVERVDGAVAVLRRGPPSGTCIVSVGAAELLGAEFGVSH